MEEDLEPGCVENCGEFANFMFTQINTFPKPPVVAASRVRLWKTQTNKSNYHKSKGGQGRFE